MNGAKYISNIVYFVSFILRNPVVISSLQGRRICPIRHLESNHLEEFTRKIYNGFRFFNSELYNYVRQKKKIHNKKKNPYDDLYNIVYSRATVYNQSEEILVKKKSISTITQNLCNL